MRYRFLEIDEVFDDLIELGVDPAAIHGDLKAALEEIAANSYAGGRPPQKSYEAKICNLELWAFCWPSAHFGCQVYFKFALTKGAVKDLWLVSLHVDRPRPDIKLR